MTHANIDIPIGPIASHHVTLPHPTELTLPDLSNPYPQLYGRVSFWIEQ